MRFTRLRAASRPRLFSRLSPEFRWEDHAEANVRYLGRRMLTLGRKPSGFVQFVNEHPFIPHLWYWHLGSVSVWCSGW